MKERNKHMLVCGKAYFHYHDILLMKAHLVAVVVKVINLCLVIIFQLKYKETLLFKIN